MSEPTSKKTPPVKADKSMDVLVLFRENLEAIRLWYRRESTPGREFGFYVIAELITSDMQTALEYALQGKRWTEPTKR